MQQSPELEALAHLSAFGFAGARTATMTKIAALYRPHAATILDSYLAGVFGLGPEGFSYGVTQTAEAQRRRGDRTSAMHCQGFTLDPEGAPGLGGRVARNGARHPRH